MKNFAPATKRIAALLLATTMVFFSACGSKNETQSSSSDVSSSSSVSSEAVKEPEPIKREVVAPAKETLDKLNEKVTINKDVIGWLRVPDTEVDEHILQKSDWDVKKDGEYYERRDINEQYDWFGSYFADYECKLGNRNDMSNIFTIYGHSMNDNKDSDKFSKLKRFTDQKFAEEHPYLYMTSPEDDMVFKVFAVLYTDYNFLPYYYPDKKGDELKAIINGMKDRSLFDYDVDVNEDDKLLVLSTCTYLFGKTQEEHEKYRYLVVGRLVRDGEAADAKTVKVTKNEDAKKATEP